MQGELGFEEFLLGVGEAEVGENVAATFRHASDGLTGLFCFGFHFSFERGTNSADEFRGASIAISVYIYSHVIAGIERAR